ncbi:MULTISPECIES: GNAT family N-acetyltransferase [Brucella/Ochrobactrum group]|jgi:CelD/BcsL family acetyltransferase involved in cellulose biosynthesis|uniref:GNAT family N-acetyltransferase n=1 Tax=Brucella/Ochrobactrum group TaxID=2826938 RepID=UPI000EFD80A0|nr:MULTISPECIES: GNAT family N-acetyltransferase [Brucella/Ochrobactrum group]KAB2681954.1 GNAT family N-acetyltransferase [Brucella pseudintermedia]MCO7725348.1 GNAT family N-acetyltransferase [Brucella intermedia]NKE75870.1 GNAT family N-acetyltransferase [Ochrobactrum sp. MC-1LL]
MLTNDFDIQVYKNTERLSSDWPDADDKTGSAFFVFQSKSFIRAWEASYGQKSGTELCLTEVRQSNGTPLLFLPLFIKLTYGTCVLSFIDDGVSDYNGPIIFPAAAQLSQEAAARLFEAVLAAVPPHDVIALCKMPQHVEGIANPLWPLTNLFSEASTHAISLTRRLEEIEQSIQGIKTVKKRDRALQKLDGFRFYVPQTEPQRRALLETMLRQKQRRFEETMVPGFDVHPEKRRFFEEATERLARRDALHFSALAVGETILATMWSVVRNGHYCAMITTFEDGEWSKFSPGKVIILHLLHTLKAEGYQCFDLGYGDEPWKQGLRDRTVPMRDLVRAVTLRGSISLALDRSLERIRATALYQKLRPLKWRLLRKLR